MVIGSLIAGVPNPLDPMRLLRLMSVITITAFALISMMFLIMVRITDPLLPRAVFGVLNTVLYFPSGAVYPQQGFPPWMQAIAAVDPFTYAVHAFKSLLLKNTGFEAIAFDLGLSRRLLRGLARQRPRCCSGGRCSAIRRPRRAQPAVPGVEVPPPLWWPTARRAHVCSRRADGSSRPRASGA